ncbi:MAG: three-Cys-motif partner protein TcmP, partial [Planctomycetales bacterium]|nr:three-Cys-motif partner protein TcmP [Planctomycetales bacterium]
HGHRPLCPIHSQVKLDILRTYIEAYFSTVAANPKIPIVNIHLVDAFAGGGLLKDPISGGPIAGSPLVMLNTVHGAQQTINASRTTTKLDIRARYHFADRSTSAVDQLKRGIQASEYSPKLLSGEIQIDRMAFDDYLPHLLGRIPSHPKTKALFFLDQCGWNVATLEHCNTILRHLPKAEIIWNISVESLATFANDNPDFRTAINRFGVDLGDAFTSQASFSHFSDWRKALIAIFLDKIRRGCIANYVSPFMIQHDGWGYWLLHLSNHPQANNVMKSTHWLHQNHSLHEGFPGLKMLEFNRDNFNQATMFRFDKAAAEATNESLFLELVPEIRRLGGDMTRDDLVRAIANETPADVSRIDFALAELKREGEINIRGPKGEMRRAGPKHGQDRISLPTQAKLFLPMNN